MPLTLVHMQLDIAASGDQALKLASEQQVDLIILDLNLPVLGGLEVLRALEGKSPAEIIVVTANDRVQAAVECIRLGAADYIAKPYEVEQVRAIAARVAKRKKLEAKIDDLESQLRGETSCGALLGTSAAMRALFQQIRRAAEADVDVLMRGETGPGKAPVAQEMHASRGRRRGALAGATPAAALTRAPGANAGRGGGGGGGGGFG